MAYKFQFGQAILSGALDQEGTILVKDDLGNTKAKVENDGDISGSKNLEIGGTVRFDGVASAAVDVAGDFMFFLDDTDSLMKRRAVGDFSADIAGDGLGTNANQLKVNVDDSTIETNSDTLRLKDGGTTLAKLANAAANTVIVRDANDSGVLSAKQVADTQLLIGNGAGFTAASLSGDVALANNGAVTIQAGAVEGSMLNANTTAALGGIDLLSNELTITGSVIRSHIGVTVASDSFMFLDATGSVLQDSMADYATAIAGDGLAASSGVLAVGVDDSTIETSGDALRLKDDGVTGAKLAPAVAGTGLVQDGSGNLDVAAATNGGLDVQADDIKVDINDLSAVAVDVAADFIAFSDEGTAGDPTRKVSIADLATAMAGAGISATAGVLSTDAGGAAALHDGKTLVEGYNYATGTAGGAVSLPGSPDVGDVVIVKMASAGEILIETSGSHKIDTADSIRLESPFAAVHCVYLAVNNWGIV